jgi:hypothetical protein
MSCEITRRPPGSVLSLKPGLAPPWHCSGPHGCVQQGSWARIEHRYQANWAGSRLMRRAVQQQARRKRGSDMTAMISDPSPEARGESPHRVRSDGDRASEHLREVFAGSRSAQHELQATTAALTPLHDGSVPQVHRIWVAAAFLLGVISRDALGDPDAVGPARERALDLAEADQVLLPLLASPGVREEAQLADGAGGGGAPGCGRAGRSRTRRRRMSRRPARPGTSPAPAAGRAARFGGPPSAVAEWMAVCPLVVAGRSVVQTRLPAMVKEVGAPVTGRRAVT